MKEPLNFGRQMSDVPRSTQPRQSLSNSTRRSVISHAEINVVPIADMEIPDQRPSQHNRVSQNKMGRQATAPSTHSSRLSLKKEINVAFLKQQTENLVQGKHATQRRHDFISSAKAESGGSKSIQKFHLGTMTFSSFRQVWFFSRAKHHTFRMLDELAEQLSFQAGEVVLEAGQTFDLGFCVVEQGSVIRTTATGETVGSPLIPGYHFGIWVLAGVDNDVQYTAQCRYAAGPDGAIIQTLSKATFDKILANAKGKDEGHEALEFLRSVRKNLMKSNLYSKMPPRLILALLEHLEHVRFTRGEALFTRGGPSGALYFIWTGHAAGEVDLDVEEHQEENGKNNGEPKGEPKGETLRIPITRFGPGAMMGKYDGLSTIATEPNTVRVTNEQLTALCLQQEHLLNELVLFPEAKEQFIALAADIDKIFYNGRNEEHGVSVPLSSIPLFASCGAITLTLLAAHCEYFVALPRSLITRQGVDADGFYVVQDGVVDVEISGINIGSVGRGARFGEFGMIGSTVRNLVAFRAPQNAGVALTVIRRPLFEVIAALFPSELTPVLWMDRNSFRLNDKIVQEAFGRLDLFANCSKETMMLLRQGSFLRLVMPESVVDGGIQIHTDSSDSQGLVVLIKGEGLRDGDPVHEGSAWGYRSLLGLEETNVQAKTTAFKEPCITAYLHKSVFEDIVRRSSVPEQVDFKAFAKHTLDNGEESLPDLFKWPSFQGCRTYFLGILERHVERRVYMNDEVILYIEGSPRGYDKARSSLIYIEFGSASVYDDEGKMVKALAAGDTFGELCLLKIPLPKGYQIVAKSTCDVHWLSIDGFDYGCSGFPDQVSHYRQSVADYYVANHLKEDETDFMEALKKSPLLHMASPKFLEEVSSALESRLYLPGEALVKQGSVGGSMFLMHRGVATLEIDGSHVRNFVKGDVFGELSMLDMGLTRTASVHAVDVCVAQCLDRSSFYDVLKKNPNDEGTAAALTNLRTDSAGLLHQQQIRQMRLFANSDHAFVSKLCENMEPRFFSPGETVFNESDRPPFFLALLITGQISIYVGRERVGVVLKGDTVGETAALGLTNKRTATLKASEVTSGEPCYCFMLHQSVLQSIFDEFPEERSKLEQIAAQKYGLATAASQRQQLLVEESVDKLMTCGRSFLFNGCSKEFLEAMVKSGVDVVTRQPGQAIVESCTDCRSLFVILEGEAHVMLGPTHAACLRKMAAIGELSILGIFTKQLATVRAVSPTQILQLPTKVLNAVASRPEFSADQEWLDDLRGFLLDQGEHGIFRELPFFACCDLPLVQILALNMAPLSLQSRCTWTPGAGPDRGEVLIFPLIDQAAITLPKGQQVQPVILERGSIISDVLLRKYHAWVAALDAPCMLGLLYAYDLHAAVVHFPGMRLWFQDFQAQQQALFSAVEKDLQARCTWATVTKKHPLDSEIAAWVQERGEAKDRAAALLTLRRQGVVAAA